MKTNYGNIFSYLEEYYFPETIIGFDERLMLEIKTIEQLKSEEGDTILEAINNPPGTKKRNWHTEEVEESAKVKSETEYRTSAEVKELLKISNTTLYNYMKSGKLKPRKISRNNYFFRKDILKLIE